MIDWELATATGLRLIPGGPETSGEEARRVVRQLRRASERAVMPVQEVTGLEAPFEANRTVVVGRPEWLRSNVSQMAEAIAPVAHLLQERRPPAAVAAVGSRATALQMGAVLAWLSGKVLGQFEAFGAQGRLLLVAPNIVHAERQLDVDPTDFRLWVCLHEETHRVQFGAVPWLSGHFTAEVHTYLSSTDDDARSALARVAAGLRGPSAGDGPAGDERPGLIDLVQSPEQREVLDRLTALMSLLEGHADVVMDEVGPGIVPSVAVIRTRFNARRHRASGLDGALRRLLGLDRKMRQYTEGAAFVRGVVDRVGMSGFNAVWSGPEALPSLQEIGEPEAWIARVHG
ncbi:MAG: zinc-dependent metalloprotease [bacterium]